MRPGPNMIYGGMLFLAVFVVGSLLLYGGAKVIQPSHPAAEAGAGPTGGEPTTPGGPTVVTIVARNLTFDKRTLNAAAGAPVTVTLDNEDAGVLHNLSFYTSRAATSKIAGGDLLAGVAKEDVKFTAPKAGTYYFRCDVHPDTMNGAFSVK